MLPSWSAGELAAGVLLSNSWGAVKWQLGSLLLSYWDLCRGCGLGGHAHSVQVAGGPKQVNEWTCGKKSVSLWAGDVWICTGEDECIGLCTRRVNEKVVKPSQLRSMSIPVQGDEWTWEGVWACVNWKPDDVGRLSAKKGQADLTDVFALELNIICCLVTELIVIDSSPSNVHAWKYCARVKQAHLPWRPGCNVRTTSKHLQ